MGYSLLNNNALGGAPTTEAFSPSPARFLTGSTNAGTAGEGQGKRLLNNEGSHDHC